MQAPYQYLMIIITLSHKNNHHASYEISNSSINLENVSRINKYKIHDIILYLAQL